MINRIAIFLLIFLTLGNTSCKTAYEEVRQSNDPEKILAAANKYFDEGDYLKSQGLYETIIPYYRGKTEAEDLFYRYSYSYYNQGDFNIASHYFNNYVKTFYNSPRKEEMAFMSAYSNYQLSPNYKLDQTPSEKAMIEMQTFINTYPSSPRIEECNALMDELRKKMEMKVYKQGKLYYDLKNYQAAMTSFNNMLKDYPETQRDEEVRYLIVKSSEELARNSIYEKMEARLKETIEKCDKYEQRYPSSDKLKELKEVKNYCNNELKRFINE